MLKADNAFKYRDLLPQPPPEPVAFIIYSHHLDDQS
jgi:hypothetical protein